MDASIILASLAALKEIIEIIDLAKKLGRGVVDLKDIEAAFKKADLAEENWDESRNG